jgi:Bacterial dnaA protein helix-turn-helix
MRYEDITSSMSFIAEQHKLHKERQDRIKQAAIKELTKSFPVTPPEPPKPPAEVVLPLTPPPEGVEPPYITIYDVIMRCVCKHYNVRKDDVLSQRRLGNVVKARHAAAIMMFRFTRWTTFKIADKLKRDPSTIFYILQKQTNEPSDFTELENQIKEKIPLINPIIKVTP